MQTNSPFDLSDLLNQRVSSLSDGQAETAVLASNTDFSNDSNGVAKLVNETQKEEGRVVQNETTTGTEPPAFFGVDSGKGPQYTLKQEKAHHRVIIYALASGKTPGEIAEEFGFTPAMVYYVEKQPWAKEQVKSLIHQHGGDAVEKTLKGAALDAATVLVNMKDDEKAPHAVRVNAAKEILDRIYGRSQQIINHRKVEPSDITDDELAKLATAGTSTSS